MVLEQVVTTNRRTSVITLLTINPREAGRTTTGDRNPQLNACPIVFTTHLTTRSFEGERKVVSKVVFFEKKQINLFSVRFLSPCHFQISENPRYVSNV